MATGRDESRGGGKKAGRARPKKPRGKGKTPSAGKSKTSGAVAKKPPSAPAPGPRTSDGKSAQPALDAVTGSRRQLARMLGRSDGTIRRWLQRADWPFGQDGPWPVAKVGAWAQIKLRPDRAHGPELPSGGPAATIDAQSRRARTLLNAERAAAVRLDREIKLGLYHLTEECRAQRLRQIHAARARMMSIPRRLAPKLARKSTTDIERMLDAEIRGALNQLADADGEEPR